MIGEGFTLALGGGGGRGWAHIGVARALEDAAMRPSLIVGTSMGAIVGAGLAAGFSAEQIEKVALRTPVYRLLGRRARLAMFDPGPVLDRLAAELGDPLIEELPTRLAVSTYDLGRGQAVAITSGRVIDAVRRSISIPLFFPPCPDADGIWCDAGSWESVPVSHARQLSPDPVIGVWVDMPKPAILAARPVSGVLRGISRRLSARGEGTRLSARRYLGLLAARMAEPVVAVEPDLLIRPRLGIAQAWRFDRVAVMSRLGYRDARIALQAWPSVGRVPVGNAAS